MPTGERNVSAYVKSGRSHCFPNDVPITICHQMRAKEELRTRERRTRKRWGTGFLVGPSGGKVIVTGRRVGPMCSGGALETGQGRACRENLEM